MTETKALVPVEQKEESKVCVVVTTTQGRPDQRRDMLCLPLDYLSGFLFGINANRVKSDLRERVIRYQRECYKVLVIAIFAHMFYNEGYECSP